MKVLIGLSNPKENTAYKMCIAEVDEINEKRYSTPEWMELDINKLVECSNIQVNVANFKDKMQNPAEYLQASFDVNRLIGWKRRDTDFQITNIYYDENNQPQLYRAVNSSGYVDMHDISELEYRKEASLLGKTSEELPDYVRKEPLSCAYEWWKAKDEAGKTVESRWISGQFETYESMPVKLLYHYLTGVRGFKEGFHVMTEENDGYTSGIRHEYLLYKGTANIKLTEIVPTKKDSHGFGMFYGQKDPYPAERKLSYCGARMSMLCDKEKYPTVVSAFDLYNNITSEGFHDENGIDIVLDARNGLMATYNKLEETGCIQDNWRLGEYTEFFGMSDYNVIPNELKLLSCKLQNEKEGTRNGVHTFTVTNGPWSALHTDCWLETIGFALSVQYYSPEFTEQIRPILNSYQSYYSKNFKRLIEWLGAKNTLETMKWAKETAKKIMSTISVVQSDGSIQKSNIDVVDKMAGLFTYKRNNYDLPDWLQIYSPSTIEALGGVDLLKQTFTARGEENVKEGIAILAEGIEAEERAELRRKNESFIKPEEIIQDGVGTMSEVSGVGRK